MEYGLRRYEAFQRLFWFAFFLACLALAYPVAKSCQSSYSEIAALAPPLGPDAIKSSAFWFQLHWVRDDSLIVFALVYLLWVEMLFLGGRLGWLTVQYIAKFFVKRVLDSTIRQSTGRSAVALNSPAVNYSRLFPTEILVDRIRQVPLHSLLHPFQRLRLMLGTPQVTPSSEDLIEKERRIVETDWNILWSSWSPFLWLFWLIPLLALLQSSRMFYLQLEPLLGGKEELQNLLAPMAGSLVPLVQVVTIAILFNLAAGLLKRLENLYLSNVDALLYDNFLSRIPFQSSDTLILLEAMQKHFQEIQRLLKRIDRSETNDKESMGARLG